MKKNTWRKDGQCHAPDAFYSFKHWACRHWAQEGVLNPVCVVPAVSSWFTSYSQIHTLYIKAQPPPFFCCCFLFKKSKLSPQRYKNSKYWSSWRMVHLTPQATQASAHCPQPSPLWGNNAKWPPVLSAADCKYLKEINFSEWKAPFFVLQLPLLPSRVDFGAVHTASTCTSQLFACQDHCGFLARF